MKPIFSNDRKGPRMRKASFSKLVVTKELHKKFIKEFPEYKWMNWNTFFNMWKDIAGKIRHETIYNPLGTKLGFHCGELKFQYLPYHKETIDIIASQKLGQKVTHLNLESKGKVPKIKWERREAVKRNKILQFYAFNESREINELAKIYGKSNSHAMRISRVTLGGHSVWRQKIKKK